MKKFNAPFDSYEVLSDRPMAIELNPQGIARYTELYNHPIYYFNSFQFMGGGLFRAILGYEEVWDKELEDSFVRQLDHTLHYHMEKGHYYFEEIAFLYDGKFHGHPWKGGVQIPKMDMGYAHPKEVTKGQRALARINLLDKPNHVDLDFEDGDIFRIPYMTFLNFKHKWIRSLETDEKPAPKQTRAIEENGQSRETSAFKSFSEEIPARDLPNNVLNMQNRFRRPSPVQKAHPPLSRYLVPK